MTVTINSCSEIVFNTLEIYNVNVDDITALSVQYGLNCSALTTVDLTDSIGDIYTATGNEETGTNFTLTPQQLFEDESSEKFCEGVYYFEWTFTAEDTTYSFSMCTLLDCENTIGCAIAEYWVDTNDDLPITLYQVLEFQNDCDTCQCSEACKIYKKLTNLLNLNNVSTDGCGCS